MRRVGIVSFAQLTSPRERRRNEVELVIPVVQEAVRASGIPKAEIGFTCSGSCDYLAGGPFTFVAGLDAVGAWPPIPESHVEADAAWALYEAWLVIQSGEADSALVYGFGKPSLGDVDEILGLQADPYTVAPLWPSATDLAAMAASAAIGAGVVDEREMAEAAAAARRAGLENPHAVVGEDVTAEELLGRPVTRPPLRDADVAPVTDGSAAIVLAAEELARRVCDRLVWITGIAHRVDTPSLGARDLTDVASARSAAAAAGVDGGPVDVAELSARHSHEVVLLRRALGLGPGTVVNPSGGALVADPVMSTGLIRIGEAAGAVRSGDARRAVAHAASGPALQQNLVCVLEGE
jgi:acetyl-CoA acetyltransferase